MSFCVDYDECCDNQALIKELEKENGRLIKAMTDDVSAARACCGRTEPLRRCSSYVQRGRTCPNCPMEWVSGCSKALKESGE